MSALNAGTGWVGIGPRAHRLVRVRLSDLGVEGAGARPSVPGERFGAKEKVL